MYSSIINNNYIILDFSQNRNPFIKVSTRWFCKSNSVMFFCENTLNCKSTPSKPLTCNHLVSDSVYSLLTRENNFSQNLTGKNMITNNNSITLPEQRISLTEQSHHSGLDTETQQQNDSRVMILDRSLRMIQ